MALVDIIKYEGDNSTFVWKHPCEDFNIKTIQSNLGHSSAAFTLDVYGHCTEEMKKASANRMESYMKVVMKQ